jgi:hypothetical protein
MQLSEGRIALRWTIGDVSGRGFEALRLSVWGARRLFGDDAALVICCNNLQLQQACAKAGPLPEGVVWHDATEALPGWMRSWFGDGMAEGVGWKFAPLRLFPGRYEISLDNDCILWAMPEALRLWLSGAAPGRCVMAEDVRPAFGRFAPFCGPRPMNSGIRGLPPGFDLEEALRAMLERASAAEGRRAVVNSELDEQGLQVAALSQASGCELLTVRTTEVTICSPFWPHQPELGSCGAHFVGLNARHIAWDYYDRPADDWMREHWARHRERLQAHTGAPRTSHPPAAE